MQEPDQKAKKHSLKLIKLIKNKINTSGGKISFADFMSTALYHQPLGYYKNTICDKFGKSGDFITAPVLGEMFSDCLATQCSHIFNTDLLEHNIEHNILEIGAGNGQLAYQLIKKLSLTPFNDLSNNHKSIKLHKYYIIESSPILQSRQKTLLLSSDLQLEAKQKIVWAKEVPKDFIGIIIANEVLDAIPVNLFTIKNGEILEKVVTLTNNKFKFIYTPPDYNLLNHIAKLPISSLLSNNFAKDKEYHSEICLLMPNLIRSITTKLKKGSIFLFDYGFLAKEYYHPDRACGTLTCYYQHEFHYDPFFWPGLQDLTSHVDFSMVIETALQQNLKVVAFASLANFLINNNILNIFQKKYNSPLITPSQQSQLYQEILTLTSPVEMGTNFKALHLTTEKGHP